MSGAESKSMIQLLYSSYGKKSHGLITSTSSKSFLPPAKLIQQEAERRKLEATFPPSMGLLPMASA
jgi:hypothetical protein